jgi:outer membrane protein TolC
MELAVGSAPEVRAAAADEAEAAAASRLSGSTFRPELWTSTNPGYAAGLPAPVFGQLPSIVGVELRTSLYDPSREADVLAAEARWAEARGSTAAVRAQTVRAAAELFGRCVLGQRLVAGAEARVRSAGRARERVEALRREGRATDLEVERARLEEAEGEQAAREARGSQELDELTLRRLIAWPADQPLRLAAESLAELPDAAGEDDVARAQAADPQLRALEESASALERLVRLRGRPIAPVVQAAAQYSRLYKTANWDEFYRSFNPDNWAIGASISIPIWTSGRLSTEEARAMASLDRMVARRRTRERDLELEVRRAQGSIVRGRARASLGRQAEAVAREALRVTQALAAEGRVDATEVAAKEGALAEAGQGVARAELDLLRARLQLLGLRGELPGRP